jgi:hypothetical protein
MGRHIIAAAAKHHGLDHERRFAELQSGIGR